MATLIELAQKGFLFRYGPQLGSKELEQRLVYITKTARSWMEHSLLALNPTWTTEISPDEQVYDLLAEFCAGGPLKYDHQFKVLSPRGEGIWELKTPDVRLFGWFPHKDCFVIVNGEATQKLKNQKSDKLDLYKRNIAQASAFRRMLQLDEPKYVAGDDPNDVISTSN